MTQIVVGIDGSPGSQQALRWALEQARCRDAQLNAIVVHQPQVAWMLEAPGAAPFDPTAGVEHAKELLDQAVDAALAGRPAGVVVERIIVTGDPAKVLVEASEGADLLVIGSRGRGAVTGLLLGSVGLHCATHARCPITIVR